jgi:hypothetical protein
MADETDTATATHARLLIDERTDAQGELVRTWLVARSGEVSLCGDAGSPRPLPTGAVAAVMRRFGAPPAEDPRDEAVSEERPSLSLPDGESLLRFRFRPRYDVIARDYLLWSDGREALCALSVTVAGALEHLAVAFHGAHGAD